MFRHIGHVDDPALPEIDADPAVLHQAVQAVEHRRQPLAFLRRQEVGNDDEGVRGGVGEAVKTEEGGGCETEDVIDCEDGELAG